MTAGDFLLMRWLNSEFLGHRNRPERPDGRPLHAYRCSDAELSELQRRLQNAVKPPAVAEGHYISAAFCLYTAEWWHRNYTGGPWAWEPIFATIGRPYDHPTAASLTETGLAFWRRDLRIRGGNRQFLVSLLLEGGFPLRIVEQEHGNLRRYLMRVLDELDRAGGAPDLAAPIAESAAATLPASLRHSELYQIVGQMLAEIISLREYLPETLGNRDPVKLLDDRAPGWRDQLPLSIDDVPAQRLIHALLKESVGLKHRGQLLSSLCYRILLAGGNGWQSAIGFTMKGVITPALLSDFGADLQDTVRARLVASGLLADRVVSPLAILRPSQDRSEPWQISPLSGAATPVEFPLDRTAEIAVVIDGRQFGTVALPGGQAQTSAILVFQQDDEAEVAELAAGDLVPPRSPLRLCAAGSVRTSRPRLFALVDTDQVEWAVSEGGSVREISSIDAGDKRLIEVRGSVEFRTQEDDLPVRLSTSVENDNRAHLIVQGRHAPWNVFNAEAYVGTVRPFVVENDGHPKPASPEVLRWRAAGTRNWGQFPSRRLPPGESDIALVEANALVDKMRLVVLPDDMQIDVLPVDRQRGSVHIRGTGDALVTVDHSVLPDDVFVETTESDVDGVDVALRCESIPPPSLQIEFRWSRGRPVCIVLPFPVRGAGFLDSDDSWLLATQRLSVERLYGVRGRALGTAGAVLWGELYALDVAGRRPFIWRPFQLEISLSSLKPAFNRLLAASKEMDAEIRLEIESGAQSAKLRLRRFDIDLEIGDEFATLAGSSAALDLLEREGKPSIDVVARELTSISDEEVALRPVPEAHAAFPGWHLSDAERLSGPRLIYGRINGRYRIRPRILAAPEQPTAPGSEHQAMTLQEIVQISNTRDRVAAMREHFCQLAEKPSHPDWQEIDAAREFLQGRLPLTTLDYFDALIDVPEAAIGFLLISATEGRIESVLSMDDELPFLWTLLLIDAWITAFSRYRSYLLDAITDSSGDLGLADRLATDRILHILDRIVIAEPVLRGQTAVVREHLQLPAVDGGIGPDAARHPAVRQVLHEQLSAVRAECLQRNDESRWPPPYEFRALMAGLPDENEVAGTGFRTATLDAPYAAAKIAAGNYQALDDTIQWIREYREFDPAYFDGTYPLAVILSIGNDGEVAEA